MGHNHWHINDRHREGTIMHKKLLLPLMFLLVIVLAGSVSGLSEDLGENYDGITPNVGTGLTVASIVCQTFSMGATSENLAFDLHNISFRAYYENGGENFSVSIYNASGDGSGLIKPNSTSPLFISTPENATLFFPQSPTSGWANISVNTLGITLSRNTNYSVCIGNLTQTGTGDISLWGRSSAPLASVGSSWRFIPASNIWVSLGADDYFFKLFGKFHDYNKSTTETFTSRAIETDTITFTLNISKDSPTTSNSSAVFYYNNTKYSPTKSNQATYDLYTASITLPFQTPESYVNTYYWAYNYSNTTRTLAENTTSGTTTTYQMQVNQCNTTANNNYPAQNFTSKDEITSTALEVNVTGTYEIWLTPTKTRINQFYVTNMSTFSACVYPEFASYTSNIDFEYQRTGYDIRHYTQSSYNIDNTTELVSLYLLTGGTTLTIVVNDDDDVDVQGATVQILRDFTGNETWEIVDSGITNWGGEVAFSVDTSKSYKIRIYRGGTLEIDTSAFQVVTTTLYFTLSAAQTIKLQDQANLALIMYNLTYTNKTNIVSFFWNDPSNVSLVFCLNVTNYNNQTYGNCSTAATDTFTYLVPTLNTSYEAKAWTRTQSGNLFLLDVLGIDQERLWEKYGQEGAMYTYIIYLVIVFIAFQSPIAAISAGNIAFIMIYLFHFIPFGWPELVGLIAMNMLIVWRLKKR